MSGPSRIVDAWINPNLPDVAEVWHEQEHPRDVAERLFAARDRIGEGEPIHDTVAAMDAAGVAGGVLSSMREYSPYPDLMRFHELVAELCAAHPDRFVAAGGVDPIHDGVGPAAQMVERLVGELGFRAIKIMPSLAGAPPNDARFYPVYERCAAHGAPITVNVGFPGPKAPAELQRPLHVEDVLRHFPGLTVVMTHVGWPWHEEVLGLVLKYEGAYLMTSAWAPKHYPPELVHHLGRRAQGKIMFATDYPLLSFERCVREARELSLSPDAAAAFLHRTAEEVFGWPP